MSTPATNKYAPPRSQVQDPELAPAGFELAARGTRLGASIIDGLVFGLPFVASFILAAPMMQRGSGVNPFAIWRLAAHTGVAFYVGIVIELVVIGVSTVFVYRDAQTIGKKLCDIKVARADGSRATLARILFLRYLPSALLQFIPVLTQLYSLADALFILGRARRCIHDYIADTIVIEA